jgi:hypothetical protein
MDSFWKCGKVFINLIEAQRKYVKVYRWSRNCLRTPENVLETSRKYIQICYGTTN